jgi:hypothetical protein
MDEMILSGTLSFFFFWVGQECFDVLNLGLMLLAFQITVRKTRHAYLVSEQSVMQRRHKLSLLSVKQ